MTKHNFIFVALSMSLIFAPTSMAQRYGRGGEQTLTFKGKFVRQGKAMGVNVDGTILPLRGRPMVTFNYKKMDASLVKPGMRIGFSGTAKGSNSIDASRVTIYPFPRSVGVGDNMKRSFKGLDVTVGGMGTILSLNPTIIRSVNENGQRVHFTLSNTPEITASGQMRLEDIIVGETVSAEFVTQINTRSSATLSIDVVKSRILNCKSIRVEREQLAANKTPTTKKSSRSRRKK